METEEITKLVDGIYKNILDKFNPGARQLITAGKAYLKALHGAAAASRLYIEAIHKLARQAQQGTWGGCSDVGSSLMKIVEVYKGIHTQQMNILKAFYVDLLVPLETNLEKDTKVVQSEQKKFLQQHKQRSESYSKAVATMKKQRKKNKGNTKTGLAMDKELKHMQVLEEEKSKLDAFCEQSLKTAMTQERRRYGFVLERQCSLAKHYLAYHTQGCALLQRYLDDWHEVSQTREYLPEAVEAVFNARLRQVSFWPDEDVYSSPKVPNIDEDRLSIASQLRKTKSMDASCLDMRSIGDVTSPMKPLSRAKSEFNLSASTHSLVQEPETPTRPKSMAVPDRGFECQLVRALYAYLSSGENQLSFLEGDIIALLGDRNKGWQFGENLRTQVTGWFPLAYTELLLDETPSSPSIQRILNEAMNSTTAATTPATPTNQMNNSFGSVTSPTGTGPTQNTSKSSGTNTLDMSRSAGPVTMFGDTLVHRTAFAKQVGARIRRGGAASTNVCPPPNLPAPIPTPKVPLPPHPQTLPVTRGVTDRRLLNPPPMPPVPTLHNNTKRAPGVIGTGVGNLSLHSSNDSGFSNDPPPAPEVDYSDDEAANKPSPAAPQAPVSRSNGPPENVRDKRKKQLLSSVRGWLLYKSALDLWDDVNNQYAKNTTGSNTTGRKIKETSHGINGINKNPSGSSSSHPPALRQASSLGHLATLGRISHSSDHRSSSVSPSTNENNRYPVKAHSLNMTNDTVSINSGTLVKRSRSLWKFKRSHKDSIILHGMSLWQHRSLIDVQMAVELEDDKRKDRSPTHIIKPKLSVAKTDEDLGTSVDISEETSLSVSPDVSHRVSKSADDLLANNGTYEVPNDSRHHRSLKKSKLTDSDETIHVDDDGLVEQRRVEPKRIRNYISTDDDDDRDDNESDVTEHDGETESCIVVNDHTKSSTLRRKQLTNGSLLPRTKLLKHSSSSKKQQHVANGSNKDDRDKTAGLLEYGQSLKNRMRKPERGSRFDQLSQKTGNMYGPWYDLWGSDPSVSVYQNGKKKH